MAATLKQSWTIEELKEPGYERVLKVTDREVGLQAIIALHNTVLGPALGGIRIYPYATFDAALMDVLRLARGMTYKSAIADVGLGGGKSVIIADPKFQKTEALLRRFGEVVHSLGGSYICAEDVGCTTSDVLHISKETHYVVGLEHDKSSGDPSPYTAWGTFLGIQAVLQATFGDPSVCGRKIAIQGVGSVGARLAELLFWHGAELTIADVDPERVKKYAKLYGAHVVSTEDVVTIACDVFAPCALGGVLHAGVIPKMRCRAVAGCANNQLFKESDGGLLMQYGILYAPDFVINAGGLINVSHEISPQGYAASRARKDVDKIYERLLSIFAIAKQKKCSTNQAVMDLVEYRLQHGVGKRVKSLHFHHKG